MDVVAFMIRIPVAFIFATIVVLNMLQASLFAKMTQPLKGVMSAIAAAIIGVALSLMYDALAPTLTSQLSAGPPATTLSVGWPRRSSPSPSRWWCSTPSSSSFGRSSELSHSATN
jgi:hypothetical protein